ncbi:DUF6746 family protein [Marinobacter sp.]|uniref:DUF6746 family protein n=1 Tax=Marinobacter sp. TaxID=50741 RepID=UPI00384FC7F4
MRNIISGICLVSGLLLSSGLAAEVRHYKGEPSETLGQAFANLAEYNEKLEALLGSAPGPAAMAEVHQLTYTLENALGRISTELDDLAATLEEVHLASEHAAPETVLSQGREYLETSRKLLRESE